MDDARLILVVTLTVSQNAMEDFERYEACAAAIMTKHAGSLERIIRLADDRTDVFREVHIASFRDEASFDSYRRDPELEALKTLRDRTILRTQIDQGRDHGVYGLTDSSARVSASETRTDAREQASESPLL